MKHFDGNHHGYHSLDSAHREMVRIGNYINKVKKQKENQERVEDLQCNTTGWTGKSVLLSAINNRLLSVRAGGCACDRRLQIPCVWVFSELVILEKQSLLHLKHGFTIQL